MKKLEKNPDILGKYDNVIAEQLDSGIIEKVPEVDTAKEMHYLPHTMVVRDNPQTIKVRIVYDASSKDR